MAQNTASQLQSLGEKYIEALRPLTEDIRNVETFFEQVSRLISNYNHERRKVINKSVDELTSSSLTP